MSAIGEIRKALDERTIAQKIGIQHDQARIEYPLRKNTVRDFDEFSDLIGDYYNHHFTRCVSHGGSLARPDAQSRAKEILESEYRRRNGNITSAFNDAHDGTNNGMRGILDAVANALKAESVERYIRDVFDRHVAPNSWPQKVEIMRQFIAEFGGNLSSSIQVDEPERYAQDYVQLIREYVEGMRRTSSVFRRL